MPRGKQPFKIQQNTKPFKRSNESDLQLDGLPSHWHDLRPELHPDGVAGVVLESALDELVQEAGLARASAADHQELEEVVVRVGEVARVALGQRRARLVHGFTSFEALLYVEEDQKSFFMGHW